ncbi:hypothetical protein AB0O76_40795 [Streptomyces sp. NPDC086554]
MADLVDTLGFYQCDCGFSFVEQYDRTEAPYLEAFCPACETPGDNE